jgi:hypothetical protein
MQKLRITYVHYLQIAAPVSAHYYSIKFSTVAVVPELLKFRAFIINESFIPSVLKGYKVLESIKFRSRKPRLTAVGIRFADHATPSIRKSWRSLGRYSTLAD